MFQFTTTFIQINYLGVRFKPIVCPSPPLFFYPKDGGSSKLRSVLPRLHGVTAKTTANTPAQSPPRELQNILSSCNFYGFLSTHCFISCFLVTLCIASFLSFFYSPLYRMLEYSSISSVLLLRNWHIQFTIQTKKKAQKHSESHRGPCVCSDRGNCIIGKDLVRTAQQTHSVSVIKTSQLMLYREIIAVCSQIHTKHINTLCGQNVQLYIKIQSVPRSKHTASLL